jgi:hypothetical protein
MHGSALKLRRQCPTPIAVSPAKLRLRTDADDEPVVVALVPATPRRVTFGRPSMDLLPVVNVVSGVAGR